jgi:hypothetical protein
MCSAACKRHRERERHGVGPVKSKTCVVCSGSFHSAQPRAVVCSNTCRQYYKGKWIREWCVANRDRVNECRRERRAADRERDREDRRKWRAGNRERVKRHQRKWCRKQCLAYAAFQILDLIPEHLPLRTKRSVAYQAMKKHHPEFFQEEK